MSVSLRRRCWLCGREECPESDVRLHYIQRIDQHECEACTARITRVDERAERARRPTRSGRA